jgi:hypothetical protein
MVSRGRRGFKNWHHASRIFNVKAGRIVDKASDRVRSRGKPISQATVWETARHVEYVYRENATVDRSRQR